MPVDCLDIDLRVTRRWQPPMFRATTNGLASGNTVDEAILHALYEVIERDTLARLESAPWSTVAPDTVVGHSRALLDHYRDAKIKVLISVLPSPLGIPCFSATIWNDNFPVPRNGFGCHLDSDVALCRALTEAAQVRVSYIAGSRDDLQDREYRDVQRAIANPADAAIFELAETATAVDFTTIQSLTVLDLRQEIDELATRVVDVTGRSPLVVDHTRDDFGIPVARSFQIRPGVAWEEPLLDRLQHTPGFARAAAIAQASHEVETERVRRDPTYSSAHLALEPIRQLLITLWGSTEQDADIHALDRGFSSLQEAADTARPFYLIVHCGADLGELSDFSAKAPSTASAGTRPTSG